MKKFYIYNMAVKSKNKKILKRSKKSKKILKKRGGYKPKIAICTHNFGNFRKEVTEKIDNFTQYSDFDYFFITDLDIKSEKWKILKVPLQPRTEHMNANRVTSRYYKWKHIHPNLKKYDYILQVDTRNISDRLSKFTDKDIYNIIKLNPNVLFFGRKHPKLKSIYEEGEYVKKLNIDYPANIDKHLEYLKKENFSQKFTHIEGCIFIKKNCEKLNNILGKVFDHMMEKKLCRDQHFFCYIIQKYGLTQDEFKILDIF